MIRNMVLLANQDIRAGDLKGSGRHSSKVYIGSSAPGRFLIPFLSDIIGIEQANQWQRSTHRL